MQRRKFTDLSFCVILPFDKFKEPNAAMVYIKKEYVTGYWKTDHNVTLGQLHFIGPANSHTHALSMH